MAYFFRTETSLQAEDPAKKFTRFKNSHVREAPKPTADTNIAPYVRPTIAPSPYVTEAAQVTKRKKTDAAADLHATDPISIEVLRRALPLRCANIQD